MSSVTFVFNFYLFSIGVFYFPSTAHHTLINYIKVLFSVSDENISYSHIFVYVILRFKSRLLELLQITFEAKGES